MPPSNQSRSGNTSSPNEAATESFAPPEGTLAPAETLPPNATGSHPAVGTLSPAQLPRRFGDYELLAEVARGGMGVVFRARQCRLNRTVAVKMILDRHLAGGEEVRRFHAEAEAAANLDHPGIVAIHEVGEIDGQHFFSMDYVDGGSLADLIAGLPLQARRAAELAEQIALVVDHAHQRGTLHRDLKPGNVMLDSNGQVRITDFGLAKRVDGASNLTATGQVLGTPAYMPPEQAGGRTEQLGPQSDVYSIGAILYEMLTGRAPFQAETPLDILLQVLETDPVPPRLLNPKTPRDLETICLKCLQKDPALRYRSAGDVAADVRRFLDDTPIQAASINLLERMSRALARSQHEEHFRSWGLAMMAFGLTILLAHAAIFLLHWAGLPPLVAYWLPRGAMFAGVFLVLWRSRRQSLLPTNAAERPIWTVWVGYLLALTAAYGVVGQDDAPELYAVSSLLSGLCFFMMGSLVWGGCYAMGLAFLLSAPLQARVGDWAALLFGMLWGVSLLVLGHRFWRLSQAGHEGRRPAQSG